MKKIIIDTDIADDIDDAYAILLAMNTEELDVLGIGTVYRNCRQRALILKSLLNDHGDTATEVYAGEELPLREPLFFWQYDTFGEDGKVNLAYFKKEMERFTYSGKSAVEFYRDAVKKYPNEITFVCLGPLTNLAKFATEYPEDYKKIGALHCMGGALFENSAEWNVKCDPESAEIALKNCAAPITLIPHDVTKKVFLNDGEFAAFRNCKEQSVRTLVEMTELWLSQRRYKKPPIMHDGLAVAELTNRFCEYTDYSVRICLDGVARGKTVIQNEDHTFRARCATLVNDRAFIGYIIKKLTEGKKI